MSSCEVISSRVEKFSKENVIANKLAGDLDAKLVTSSKQVLLQRIEFKPASKPDEQYEKLKKKYKPLNAGSNYSNTGQRFVTNGDGDNATFEDIPSPKRVLYSSEKVNPQWNKIRRMGPGLSNLGNTCFLNSVLQVLTYTAPLVNYLATQEHSKECHVIGFCMMCELQRHVVRTFSHQQNESIKPLSIIQRLRSIAKNLRFGHQEDAHEFLRYVIDGMQKSSLAGLPEKLERYSKETTVVHRIFGGYYRSQVQCLKCHNTSNTFDPLMEIMLEIKHTPSVLRALQRSSKPELLDGDNLYQCPRCKKKVPANKQVLIHQPPNILTIQLKRFDYNHLFGGKISKEVTYTEHLDLRPFMTNQKGPPIRYKLYAVLVHSGHSCNSGHYYCYIRGSNDCWYNMNDSVVRQCGLNTVLSQQAYLLFYSRVVNQQLCQVKKQFSPIVTKSPSSVASPSFPKIIRENDIGKPVSRSGIHFKVSTTPTSTTTKLTPSTPNGNTTPTALIPATQRPKLSFSLKTKLPGNAESTGKTKECKDSVAESVKKEGQAGGIGDAPRIPSPQKEFADPTNGEPSSTLSVGKRDDKLTSPVEKQKPDSITNKTLVANAGETSSKFKEDEGRSAVEPVTVSFPLRKDVKVESPPKKTRPPPLFIPRSVHSKGSVPCTKSDTEEQEPTISKETLTSPVKATTPWRITPKTPNEPLFGPMSPPPQGTIVPQQSPLSAVSDVSTASSIMGKTGEWAVLDKMTPTPGPRLPERQHAGWAVSDKSEAEQSTGNGNDEMVDEEDWTEAEVESDEKRTKKAKKKRKKEKRRKKKYDKLSQSGSEQETELEENDEGKDKKKEENVNKEKENKKRKKKKEKHKKYDEEKRLLVSKSDEESEESCVSREERNGRQKSHGKNGEPVERKRQRLVDYSSNESSDTTGDHGRDSSSTEQDSQEERKKNDRKDERAPPVIVYDGDKQSARKRRSTWDGSRDSSTVNQLLSNGGGLLGYGSSVTTWEGGTSVVDSYDVDEGERKRRKRRDSWNEELDKGKVKNVKDKNKHEQSHMSGIRNIFQKEHDRKNRKGVMDRVASHFTRRHSSHSRSLSGRGYRRF